MKLVALGIVLLLVGLAGWQHFRYLKARRGPVQDEQRPVRSVYASAASR